MPVVNKNGYLVDKLGNPIFPVTTEEQVITSLDGTKTLKDTREELEGAIDDINTALDDKADLVDGKVPMTQMPDVLQNDKGYFATPEALRAAYPTAVGGNHAIVETTDTVWLWDVDTSAWVDSGAKGQVASVNGRTGAVVLTKTDVGLDNVDNTSDMDKPVSTATQVELDKKIEYVITGDSTYTF